MPRRSAFLSSSTSRWGSSHERKVSMAAYGVRDDAASWEPVPADEV